MTGMNKYMYMCDILVWKLHLDRLLPLNLRSSFLSQGSQLRVHRYFSTVKELVFTKFEQRA